MPKPNTKRWLNNTEYIDLLNYIIERTKNVKSPMSIKQLVRDFKKKSGSAKAMECLRQRIHQLGFRVHNFERIDTNTKLKLLFALSGSIDPFFLKKLKKDAIVAVDNEQRITHYKANNGSLELRGDHSLSAKSRTAKRSYRPMIIDYFENKNNVSAIPKNEAQKEMKNFIEFITEKCENLNSPLSVLQLAKEFKNHFCISVPLLTIYHRIRAYCLEIQTLEFLDIHTKVKQLFCLSATLDSNFLKELRKNAVVEVDHQNRITKYTPNDSSLALRGNHWGSGRKKTGHAKKAKKEKSGVVMSDDSEEGSDNKGLNDSSDEYSSEEFDSEFDSDEGNDHAVEPEDLMQPSEETDGFDNETSGRNCSEMSIENDFDFNPPTERDTPESSKRKADTSGSNSTKRTRPTSDESMDPLEMDDNVSYEDPSRVELEPFPAPLVLPNRNEKDPDIQQTRKPRPQTIEKPIKKEYEEEAQTSLKMVLKAFKSLVRSLDTSGLSQFQMELDKKVMETERRSEVSNKEIILAMEFLIVKLSKHGALQSSEDCISLRDVLLMLRTIILNSSFNGLEVILEMLKENIEQLKVLDERVSVSKVEFVLRATLDNIFT